MTNAMQGSPYDRGAELLKFAIEEMRAQEVPHTEVAALLADFSIWTALSLGGTAGGEAILGHMRQDVTQWTLGKHPLQANGEHVVSPEAVLSDHEIDFSPLRMVMEHFLSHQRADLEHAAAYFAVYAVGLVHQRLGYERAQTVVNTAKRELKRWEAESNQGASSNKEPQERKPNTDSNFPSIPSIENQELREAVCALTRSALFMRNVVLRSAWEKNPVEDVLRKQAATARLADAVIERWSQYLGVADGEA